MRSWAISVGAIALAVALVLGVDDEDRAAQPQNCRAPGELVRVPDLPEASGVAASRRMPGVFWAHNDSADPVLFALDEHGAVTGRIRVNGATVEDWEDIAVGPCPQGSCVYIADIGDNDEGRSHITIYRTREPAPSDEATAPADRFQASYPDGPQDAESLFVTGDDGVFIVTKGSPGTVALYRFPAPLVAGRTVRLQRVAAPTSGSDDRGDRPTGADISPDGRWVAVRTNEWVALYPAATLLAGRWLEAVRTDLRALGEPQGEGVAFADDRTLVLVGEGGGTQGGTFARLTCTPRPASPLRPS